MANIYFIDESGNTGDIATQKALTGFAGQPFFSLACIGVEEKKVLDDFAKELIKKHRIQSSEFKSTNICTKKRYIIPELIDFLIKHNGKILVEIIDKRYQLCSALMDYYIFCPYIMPNRDTPESIRFWKGTYDFIYNFIDDKFIQDFICAFSTPDDDLTYIERCINNMLNLVKHHANELITFVEDVKDVFRHMKITYGNVITKKRFLPLPDFSRGKKYGILPNVNCLANIYARINKIEGDGETITIYHDEQKEFNAPLEEIKKLTEVLSSEASLITPYSDFNIKNKANLDFVSSKDEYGVQFADLISGAFMRHVYSIFNCHEIHKEFCIAYRMILERECIDLGINFIMPIYNIRKIVEQSLINS